MRTLLLAVAAASCSLMYGPPAYAQAKDLDQRYQANVALLQRENVSCLTGFPETRRLLTILRASVELKSFVPPLAAQAAICAVRNNNYEGVLEFGPDGEKISSSSDKVSSKQLQLFFLYHGFIASLVLERGEIALATFRRYATEADTNVIAEVGLQSWGMLMRYARVSPNAAEEYRFIAAQLERTEYKGLNPVERQMLQEQLAFDRLLLATTPEEKGQLLTQIKSPTSALEIFIDNRYAPLRGLPEAQRLKNVIEVARAEVDDSAKRAADNPTLLEAQIDHVRTLRSTGRPAEALALVDGLQGKLATLRLQFVDADEKENWLYNEKALALRDLGRIDESLAAMKAGSLLKTEGGENLSQTINLAILQKGAGRYENSLATLDPISSNGTKYANSLVAGLRYCASVALGRPPANGAEIIADLKGLGAEGLVSLFNTSICINNLDVAEDAFLALLADPDFRSSVLLAAQAYRQESSRRTAFEIQQRDRALLVMARPRVKAKLDEYATPFTIPLPLREFEL